MGQQLGIESELFNIEVLQIFKNVGVPMQVMADGIVDLGDL